MAASEFRYNETRIISGFTGRKGVGAMKKLRTRWSDQVREHPEEVLSEYPRPSLRRKSYVNLNGYWDYAITGRGKKPERYGGRILVPFSPEAPLSGVEQTLRPGQVLWYRRMLPRQIVRRQGFRWLLHFGAADQFAAVYVNKKLVKRHLGGYLPFSADVTDVLSGTENELIVGIRDVTDLSWYSRGKQKLQKGGMFYTAQSGIWQTVWMEEVPEAYIESLKITPLFDEGKAEFLAVSSSEGPVSVTLYEGKEICCQWTGKANEAFDVPLESVYPWSPEDPFLYSVRIRFREDQAESYFAMRKISVEKDSRGIPRTFLNNSPYLQKGVLDQGYWPDGLYTAPCDEALIFDIKEMKRLGFNMIRKHIKIEPERWYYHCDRLGMLVWQDMVCGGKPYRRWYVTYLANGLEALHIRLTDRLYGLLGRRDQRGREQFLEEMQETIRVLWNHPSIVTWVLFNEGWGQFDAKEVTALAESLDPARLIDQASGWFDQGGGDFRSIHNYFFRLRLWKDERVQALTEFGGFCWHMKEHSMYARVYGYRIYGSRKALTRGYGRLMKEVVSKIPEGLSVTVYTQLSDVEEEVNGIYTYDREILKIDENEIRKWNEQYDLSTR